MSTSPTSARSTPGAPDSASPDDDRLTWRVMVVLGLLMGYAAISNDLYLPAMPAMSRSLGTGSGVMAWTLSGYLIGFSLGQLVWGPIGDRFGRRVPIAFALVLFAVGSAGCALATSGAAMIAWRALQAVGACATVVLSRAMVRDLYHGRRAAQVMSTLLAVMAGAPLVGPLLGGQILALAGWRAIFWSLVGIAAITFVALFTVPETLPPARRRRTPVGAMAREYRALLRDRRLLRMAGAGGFFLGGLFAYLAGTPFAYIEYHGLSPSLYGAVVALGVVGVIVSNYVNSRLVMRLGTERLLARGTGLAAVAGVAAAVVAFVDRGGLVALVVPLVAFMSSAGLVIGNSVARALEHHADRAGAASGLNGALQYGLGVMTSGLVGLCADGTPRPMCVVIAVAGVCSWLCARPERTAPADAVVGAR